MVSEIQKKSIETYYERIEMLVLAYIRKHGHSPVLVYSERRELGQMVSYVEAPAKPAPEPIAPKLVELATHGARAWDEWTKGADPDVMAIVLRVTPAETIVQIVERTTQLEEELKAHAKRVQDLLRKGAN